MSEFPEVNDAVWDLFDGALRNELTPSQSEELETLLLADGALQQLFLTHLQLRVDVQFYHRARRGAETNLRGIPELNEMLSSAGVGEATPTTVRRTWEAAYDVVSNYVALSMLVSAIVIAIIVLSMGLIVPDWDAGDRTVTPAIDVVAQITGTQAATWDKSSAGNFKNIALFAGDRLVLKSGLAEVTFTDGAVVLLEGPSEFVVDHAGVGTLNVGSLFAKVPQQATGFVVFTPSAEIVDLGTEFGVRVDAEGDTVAEVIVGTIDVKRRVSKGETTSTMRLHAGDAVRVTTADEGVSQIPPTNQFTKSMPVLRRPQKKPPAPVEPPDDTPGGVVRVDFNDASPDDKRTMVGKRSGGGFARGSTWGGAARSIKLAKGDLLPPANTGYSLQQTGTAQSLQGTWKVEGNRQVFRTLRQPMLADVIWFSYLMKHEQADSSTGLVFNDQNPIAENAPVLQTEGSDLLLAGRSVANDLFVAGETYLIVGRIAVDDEGDDTIEIWVNPNVVDGLDGLGPPTGRLEAEVVDANGLATLGTVVFRKRPA